MQPRWPVAHQRECPWTFPRNSSIHPSRHQIRASGRHGCQLHFEIWNDPLGLPGGHLALQMAAKVDTLGRSRNSASPPWEGLPVSESGLPASPVCWLSLWVQSLSAHPRTPRWDDPYPSILRMEPETCASAAPCGEPWCSVSRPPDPQAFLFQSDLSERSPVERQA